TVEAFIGAVYLDLGIEEADLFIDKFILKKLENIIDQGLHIDPKSHFQEVCQDELGITPHYDLLKDEGPDHDKKFTIGAYIGEELIAEGIGSSKQKAEDDAARNALKIKGWMEHTTKSPAE
ncbi:ribonuclease III, partial [Candidatus Peregrinibacteria bacterium]|nr:ribonuclease III [Candidatus Peregrinibacteria bacterium]